MRQTSHGRQSCLTAAARCPPTLLSPQLGCDNGHNATATGDVVEWTTGGALTKVPMVRGHPHTPALAAPARLRTPPPSVRWAAVHSAWGCRLSLPACNHGLGMATPADRKNAASDRPMRADARSAQVGVSVTVTCDVTLTVTDEYGLGNSTSSTLTVRVPASAGRLPR